MAENSVYLLKSYAELSKDIYVGTFLQKTGLNFLDLCALLRKFPHCLFRNSLSHARTVPGFIGGEPKTISNALSISSFPLNTYSHTGPRPQRNHPQYGVFDGSIKYLIKWIVFFAAVFDSDDSIIDSLLWCSLLFPS